MKQTVGSFRGGEAVFGAFPASFFCHSILRTEILVSSFFASLPDVALGRHPARIRSKSCFSARVATFCLDVADLLSFFGFVRITERTACKWPCRWADGGRRTASQRRSGCSVDALTRGTHESVVRERLRQGPTASQSTGFHGVAFSQLFHFCLAIPFSFGPFVPRPPPVSGLYPPNLAHPIAWDQIGIPTRSNNSYPHTLATLGPPSLHNPTDPAGWFQPATPAASPLSPDNCYKRKRHGNAKPASALTWSIANQMFDKHILLLRWLRWTDCRQHYRILLASPIDAHSSTHIRG